MIRPLFYCRQVINGVSNCYFRCSLDMNFYIKKCKILPQCNNKMQTEMHCDNSDFNFDPYAEYLTKLISFSLA